MYREFYNLKERPFSLTPDPLFLYLGEGQQTAIDSIFYGIRQREGFMVLTGDIGTGKTTICRAILERLDKEVKTAVIFNSFLTENELLNLILQDFGFPSKERSKKECIDTLNRFLIQQLSRGENVVLLIDEAQNLSIPVLEQIRMLSNLETEKEKMLQIVLFGQLELDQKLKSSTLRQLNQRIAIRCRLLPLTRTETECYINQRLMVAGGKSKITFSRSSLNEIYKFSKGIPRLINLICDRALLGGFVEQTYHIGETIVKKARKSLSEGEVDTRLSFFRVLLKRPIRLYVSLFTIFLSLCVCIGLLSQRTENFVWEGIKDVYSQISELPGEQASEIEAIELLEDSRKVLYERGLK